MVREDALVGNRMYWVVVADEFQASIYSRAKKFSDLQAISELKNEVAREKLENLISDRGGRAFDSFGQGRHAYTKENDAKSQSNLAFARDIAAALKSSRRNDSDGLIVIAAPRFLGVLRSALGRVGLEADLAIDKEVTAKGADFVRDLIDQHY